ncbi:transcriptional regulator ovo-like isoform X2 [Phymastichus coffea]|uniref:transcriptional regulator ovo-like isoform X2 n=1 Tax=Phymastichus coffea TaxID=108790 RepID=UPI00273AEE93|nr:transcriptional regulator ovo-like isoform X2 [Phymastichus coffea]
MPKIFLIKNRLHQQQLRLLEAQHLSKSPPPPGSGHHHVIVKDVSPPPIAPTRSPSTQEPLSLIVSKHQYREKSDDERATTPESLRGGSSPAPSPPPTLVPLPPIVRPETTTTPPQQQQQQQQPSTKTARRFISSILGGDVPYGSRGHVLSKTDRIELPRPASPAARIPEAPTRVSVIQRVPTKVQAARREETKIELPRTQEPEQDQPIDYAVPKRNKDDQEESGHETTKATSRAPIDTSLARPLLAAMRVRVPAGAIHVAASGHGRSSSASGGGQSSGGSGASSGSAGGGSAGSGGGFASSGGGDAGGGAAGGSAGGGGMNPGGNGGRGNYGPSSPPTGSLPPFYESLKGGNNLANFANQYNGNGYLTASPAVGMECDTGQGDSLNSHNQYSAQEGKQYSLLQNVCASYGIALKEEEDLAGYKMQPNDLLSGQYGGYDVTDSGMMLDVVSGAGVDPLQFSATLTFTSSDHSALLESLTDAAELFLPRLTSDENAELLDETLPSPASAASNGIAQDATQLSTPVEPSVDPFPEHSISLTRGFDASRHYGAPQHFGSSKLPSLYTNGDSTYQSLNKERNELGLHINQNQTEPQLQQLQIQVQLQQQQQQAMSPHPPHHQGLLSPGLSFGSELDSASSGSLPSPGAGSCSLDATSTSTSPSCALMEHAPSPSAVATNTPSSTQEPPLVAQRVGALQQRLGLPGDLPLEFVNGGHGIKNPLAIEGQRQATTNRDEERTTRAPTSKDDDPSRFSCRVCNKNFSLQRLLNRHMKCHSDVKRYLCTFCGKGFNDTFDLKRHTRTHTGVRPYKCNLCEKSFTQRCSLESHCLKVHGVQHQYAYKERRTKVYVCEECGHTTQEPEVHYLHLKDKHPYSPALLKFYDKRHFKFTNSNFANMLLQGGLLQRDSRNPDSCVKSASKTLETTQLRRASTLLHMGRAASTF